MCLCVLRRLRVYSGEFSLYVVLLQVLGRSERVANEGDLEAGFSSSNNLNVALVYRVSVRIDNG